MVVYWKASEPKRKKVMEKRRDLASQTLHLGYVSSLP
jgi:hypothetical protein